MNSPNQKELLPPSLIPVIHKKRNNKLEELKNEKNNYKLDYTNKIIESKIRKYLTPYARTIITNLYQHKFDDLYNYIYNDVAKRIPHEIFIERSKKRVMDNLLSSIILPFEEQQIIFEERDEKAKRYKRYNNKINKDIIQKKGILIQSDNFDDINKLRCVNNIKRRNQDKKVKKLCKSREKLLDYYSSLKNNDINENQNVIKNNNEVIDNQINIKYKDNINEKGEEEENKFPIENQNILNSTLNSSLKRKEDWNKLMNYFQIKN